MPHVSPSQGNQAIWHLNWQIDGWVVSGEHGPCYGTWDGFVNHLPYHAHTILWLIWNNSLNNWKNTETSISRISRQHTKQLTYVLHTACRQGSRACPCPCPRPGRSRRGRACPCRWPAGSACRRPRTSARRPGTASPAAGSSQEAGRSFRIRRTAAWDWRGRTDWGRGPASSLLTRVLQFWHRYCDKYTIFGNAPTNRVFSIFKAPTSNFTLTKNPYNHPLMAFIQAF